MRTSNRRTPTVAFSNTVSWRVDGQEAQEVGARVAKSGYEVIGRPSVGRDIELGVSYGGSGPTVLHRAFNGSRTVADTW
jgi:hypothetical protein